MENLISNKQQHKAILVFKSLRNLAFVYLRQMFCKFGANYDLAKKLSSQTCIA